jgi:glucuronate isomerase
MTDFVANPPQLRRAEVGLDKAPPAWADYLASVSSRLREWKAKGAVAIKFTIAYYRPLDFARTTEADAKRVYDGYLQDGAQPRDYRTAEYKALQDFLFRHVVRESGRAGLVVHIHSWSPC